MKLIPIILLCFAASMTYSQIGEQSVQKEALAFLGFNEQAITSLAKAIPEDKFSWRPAEGVRSVSEVLMHIASGNYFILMNMGIAPPSSIDMMSMEKLQGKDKVLEALQGSFKFVQDNLLTLKDSQIPEKVKFPWAEMTRHAACFLLIDHSGEHKGQLIAYARSNGIVPPWSN